MTKDTFFSWPGSYKYLLTFPLYLIEFRHYSQIRLELNIAKISLLTYTCHMWWIWIKLKSMKNMPPVCLQQHTFSTVFTCIFYCPLKRDTGKPCLSRSESYQGPLCIQEFLLNINPRSAYVVMCFLPFGYQPTCADSQNLPTTNPLQTMLFQQCA